MLDKIYTSLKVFDLEVFTILILCALALSSLGVFLVLKKVSMVIDAISHSVLLGIVLAFLLIGQLNSPFLIVGAALVGVLTVYLVELLGKHPKISKDSAIGIVFTFFFSISIIIITTKLSGIHIDTDAVFVGNIELAHKSHLRKIIPILVINLLFVIFLYKELKILIFDPILTSILGFWPTILSYLLMTLSSITAVIAFDMFGSITTIACIIGPAATALLLTNKLFHCWLLSLWLSFISASLGYFFGICCDLPISGLISAVIFVIFILVLFLEPKKGIISKIIRQKNQRISFFMLTLLMHLQNHSLQNKKNSLQEVKNDLKFASQYYSKCLNKAVKEGYIQITPNQELTLKEAGKNFLHQKNQESN